MFRTANAVLAATLMLAFNVAAKGLTFRVAPAPEWNEFFQNTNGWLGADVAYSIPLAPNKSFWLFGDTFVGQITDGKRISSKMIHSSIATQEIGRPPQFFYRTDKKGTPESFVNSPGPKTYFWLLDGARTSRGLYFFMQQVQWINNTTWGFQCVATWLAFVENPDDPPVRWKISTRKLPFSKLPDGQDAILGCETLKTGGYIYIYGYSNNAKATSKKQLLLARAPEDKLDDLSSWEFYSNGSWMSDFQKSTPVFSDAPPEGSVLWQPYLKKFVFVYNEGIWGTIAMRTADAPEGPWNAPISLYHCPDMKISRNVFCYAGKAHPEFSGTNELLISYAANSESLPEVLNDTRLYWPRFIKVTFENR